jgi:hypothetical protein
MQHRHHCGYERAFSLDSLMDNNAKRCSRGVNPLWTGLLSTWVAGLAYSDPLALRAIPNMAVQILKSSSLSGLDSILNSPFRPSLRVTVN